MIEGELQLGKRGITSEDITRELNVDYRKMVVDMLSGFGFLPDGHMLNFFDSPKGHMGSQALYFLEEMVGRHMIFVSQLGPNGKTTIHKHQEPIREKYFQLAGSSYLRLGKDIQELREDFALTVPSDVPHQLTTRDNSSLVLIVMENAISVPRDKLHIPVVP